MARTPQGIQDKVFSPTRFRVGYEDEDDSFRTLVLTRRIADEVLRDVRDVSGHARRETRADADRIISGARVHVAEYLDGL